jgi:quinol monooxygenase YgiN
MKTLDSYTVGAQLSSNRNPTEWTNIVRTTLDPKDGYLSFINTFTVEPDDAERLLQALRDATEEIFRRQPGFISANLHISRDRRRVLNYAQWRSKEDYVAMSKQPKVQAHMKLVAALAISFDLIDYGSS